MAHDGPASPEPHHLAYGQVQAGAPKSAASRQNLPSMRPQPELSAIWACHQERGDGGHGQDKEGPQLGVW